MQPPHPSIDQLQAEEHAPGTGAESALALHPSFRIGLAYGRFVHRFRWFLLAFWIAALVASVPFAARLPSLLSSAGVHIRATDPPPGSHRLIATVPIRPRHLPGLSPTRRR